jgi:uncharacterized protein
MQSTDYQHQGDHWGPIATILWSALLAIIYVVAQGLTTGVYLGITRGNISSAELRSILPELEHDGLLLSFSAFVAVVVCCPLILVIAKLKRNSNLKDSLGLVLPSKLQALRWFLIIAAFCALSDAVSLLLGRPIVPEFLVKAYASMQKPWILWLAVLLGAPLFEELFFRGFLITGLAVSLLRWYGAVIISSAAWTLIHVQYDIFGLAFIFVLGLILGATRVQTGSTLLTMCLHSLVNLGATIETLIHLHYESA